MKQIEIFNQTVTTKKLLEAGFYRKNINSLLKEKYLFRVEKGLYGINTDKLNLNETNHVFIDKNEFLITTKEFLPTHLLVKVSEVNINLFLNTKKSEDYFKALIAFYEQIGNQYEQVIHQTNSIKEALQVKKFLENILSIANFYLDKIKNQFENEQQFLESFTNEIENIEELTQDIQLKFFDIPSKTSIHEILKRI